MQDHGLISNDGSEYDYLRARGRYLVESRYWDKVRADLMADGFSFVEPQPLEDEYYMALEAAEELKRGAMK